MGAVVVAPGLKSRGPVVVVHGHGLHIGAPCGVFQDQESNWCLLHWPVDSLPLRHQGSPEAF